MIKIENNIKLTSLGRKDCPPKRNWKSKYDNFPIIKMKIGSSFDTGVKYEYGKTISIKNTCRNKARKLNKKMSFAVREWEGKIRVWRTK